MRIRVGFSTAPGILSSVIEDVTRSNVSHAFFLIDCDLGSLVYQSDSSGPEIVTKTLFEKSRKIVVALDPAIDLTSAVQSSIEQFIGYDYDWSADASDGLNAIAERVGIPARVALSDKHASECASLVVRTMRLAAYPGVERLEEHLVTPAQLLEFMQS